MLSGCRCPHPHMTHMVGRDPSHHPAPGMGGRHDKSRSTCQLWAQSSVVASPTLQVPAGRWEVQEHQSPGGDTVTLGLPGWSRLPPHFLRELGRGQQDHSAPTFGIPGVLALTPNLWLALPQKWVGCLVQSSSSWQLSGCQGLLELAPTVSMATIGAPAPSASPRGRGRGLAGSCGAPPPGRLRLCAQGSRGSEPRRFLHVSPLHAPSSLVPSPMSLQVRLSLISLP